MRTVRRNVFEGHSGGIPDESTFSSALRSRDTAYRQYILRRIKDAERGNEIGLQYGVLLEGLEKHFSKVSR
jgi:hypothetical protein